MEDLIERAARDLAGSKKVLEYHGNSFKLRCVSCDARYEVNAEPTPLTEEQISDYLIQGKTGEILPRIVEEVKKIQKGLFVREWALVLSSISEEDAYGEKER